jgi:putative SOS response-associated peptidase YedK
MCGRYFLTTPGQVLAEEFETGPPPALAPRYNIAPTQEVAIVRVAEAAPDTDGGARELALVVWGLIPSWAKERAIGSRLINARAETLAEKPSFRDSFRRRRCLVPADGFFEWQQAGAGKRPWLIRLKSRAPFGLAGLWSRWRDPASGAALDSCAIVTTTANDLLAPIHDRMPVVVPRAARGVWLDPGSAPSALERLLVPYPADEMEGVPVSRRVNRPAHDDPRVLEPEAPA